MAKKWLPTEEEMFCPICGVEAGASVTDGEEYDVRCDECEKTLRIIVRIKD